MIKLRQSGQPRRDSGRLMMADEHRDKSWPPIPRCLDLIMPSHVVAPQVFRWAAALDRSRPMDKVSIGSRSGMARHAPLRLRRPETGLRARGSSTAPSARLGGFGCAWDCLRATPDQDEISNCKSWTVLNHPDEEITLSAESAAPKCHGGEIMRPTVPL